MKVKSLNHSTYAHLYHIVWGIKHQRKWLKDYVKQELINSLYKTCKKYPTLYLTAINTDQDHVHIQIEIPLNIAVAETVQKLKANSGMTIQKKFKFIKDLYLDWDSIWSVGYFSSTNELNDEQVRKYIEYQDKKEKPRTNKLF